MAQNNSQYRINAASSSGEKIKLLQSAFSAASGLSADENGVFWVNSAKTLGIEFSSNGSYIYTYSVNASESKNQISSSIDYDAVHIFTCNTSRDGTVFAFGVDETSLSTYKPNIAIAKAENNEMMVLAITSATAIQMKTSGASFSVSASVTKSSYIPGVTMTKMAMLSSYTTFSELYQVISAPKGTLWGTDSSIYVGGNLFKVICNSSEGCALAMRV